MKRFISFSGGVESTTMCLLYGKGAKADIGLRLIADCVETKTPDGKTKYKCERNKNNVPPAWKSEEDFFEWIKVPFVKPELRNI